MLLDSKSILDSPRARKERLETVCAAFESAWKTGQRPKLADSLMSTQASEQSDLVAELLAIDVYYRTKYGEQPVATDYLHQLPDFTSVINQHFGQNSDPPSNNSVSNVIPIVPGFTIERELGRGGMGVVYLAKQKQPRRRVAIKMIRESAGLDGLALQRFQREWDAVVRLRHPNILPIFSVGETDVRPYMAMEYSAGGGLDTALAGKPIRPASAAAIVE